MCILRIKMTHLEYLRNGPTPLNSTFREFSKRFWIISKLKDVTCIKVIKIAHPQYLRRF